MKSLVEFIKRIREEDIFSKSYLNRFIAIADKVQKSGYPTGETKGLNAVLNYLKDYENIMKKQREKAKEKAEKESTFKEKNIDNIPQIIAAICPQYYAKSPISSMI